MSSWGIVLAAGTGERFGAAKQLAMVGGVPAVARAVTAVRAVVDGVVLVVPSVDVWQGPPVDTVVPGGATRSQSVRAGLSVVPEDADVVVIHDAAHPLASPELVRAVLAAIADGADGAFAALPVTEALKRLDGPVVVGNPSKVDLVMAQMPQAFRAGLLRAVHARSPETVEDVELVSAAGARVVAVPGDPRNLHVTTRAELAIADLLAVHGSTKGNARRRSAFPTPPA
jgi:2-C-methyl-D-erythritol 4-phosphate cytidylyltransferase